MRLLAAITCQSARADVVFLVDSSRSICGSDSTCSNWRSVLNFVNSIVSQLNIGRDDTRVGFVRYSSSSETSNEFYLNDNQNNRNQITSAVSRVQYVTGRIFVGQLANALQFARTQQFVSTRGDRIGAPNIIIVLTNGGFSASSPDVSLHTNLYSEFFCFVLYNRRCVLFAHELICINLRERNTEKNKSHNYTQ